MGKQCPASLVIAVTGGLACGKSEVGRFLEGSGFCVCDADFLAHELMKKGSLIYSEILDFFGRDILDEKEEISRPILGALVFKDSEKREYLNRLVHPAVEEILKRWISQQRKEGRKAAALVPLLFESGMDRLDWDFTLCVVSDVQSVFQRLARRGLNRKDAIARIEAQMPLDEKKRRSDYVLNNFGDLSDLKQSLNHLLSNITDHF